MMARTTLKGSDPRSLPVLCQQAVCFGGHLQPSAWRLPALPSGLCRAYRSARVESLASPQCLEIPGPPSFTPAGTAAGSHIAAQPGRLSSADPPGAGHGEPNRHKPCEWAFSRQQPDKSRRGSSLDDEAFGGAPPIASPTAAVSYWFCRRPQSWRLLDSATLLGHTLLRLGRVLG